MPLTVEAVYENGMLKLAQPLPLKEHEQVQVTVHTSRTWAEISAGMMGGTRRCRGGQLLCDVSRTGLPHPRGRIMTFADLVRGESYSSPRHRPARAAGRLRNQTGQYSP